MILNALTLYINLYKPLFINCGVTVVEVDSNACPACLSLMPEVVEMVAYSTFPRHLLDKSLSSSGHSCGYHVIEFGSLT